MELVLLIGIPATGKSTFARERLFGTHLRINRDMLKTARRERVLFEACLSSSTLLVVDNTNVTRAERARFVLPARAAGFQVRGFFFESRVRDALKRNETRGRPVPDAAVLGRAGALELPSLVEGFDELFFVRLSASGGFDVAVWNET
jgi:predicted kinase